MNKKIYVYVGVILLIYSIILIIIRIGENVPHTLLWITHTGLFLATIGFLIRSNFLISSSLTMIVFYHLLWVIDFFIVFIGGGQFLDMTDYLNEVSLKYFIFTSHHMWLSPLLFFILYKEKKFHHYAWLGASSLFLLSNVLTILLIPYNVNCAHEICAPLKNTLFAEINKFGFLTYFIIMHIVNIFVLFLPLNLLFSYVIEKLKK